MVIIRLEPGARASIDGVFELVGQWGEPIGFACECRKGESLPRRPGAADQASWYVRVEQVSESRLAA